LLFGLSKAPVRSAMTGASSMAPMVLPHLAQNALLEKSDDL
jgi:hypothetical protein